MGILRSVLYALCFMLYAFPLFADSTVRVLILDEVYTAIPEKNETVKKVGKISGELLVSGTPYSGNIEVWRGKNGLYLINELSLEEYVKGVVAAEVGLKWEMEALKVQAVISRTYALYQRRMSGNSIYHLTSSTFHQVYKGKNSNARVAYAVSDTSGEILTYGETLIESLYHSTCGGRTENPEHVFGRSYPYLTSVESKCESSPYRAWQRDIPIAEIERALNLSGIQEIAVVSHTPTKRVNELKIVSDTKTVTIKATELRKALGWSRLPSTNFTLKRDVDIMIFEGRGYGHGVGLCQWCSQQMAKEGKTYREILSFFYPGTKIELYETR
ncbi:MAG: SpoIID/LytB domain-containing protein [Nitrospira sp.]|nr:SpoIID/LytB domain-containing protein [Nitrospira sp.]